MNNGHRKSIGRTGGTEGEKQTEAESKQRKAQGRASRTKQQIGQIRNRAELPSQGRKHIIRAALTRQEAHHQSCPHKAGSTSSELPSQGRKHIIRAALSRQEADHPEQRLPQCLCGVLH